MPSSTPSTPPPPTTFTTSFPDHHSLSTDQLFKSSIAMSTHPSTPTIEPLPHLDYFLLNQLITLIHPHLTKHQLKRIEYIVDARRSFYEGHEKFQIAYRDLLDAYACAEMLDREMERLLAVTANDHQETAMLKNRLEAVEAQRISNNVDLQARLERVRSKTKLRSLISFWYSDLKVVFVRDEMPWLVELGKRRCEWGREGDEATKRMMGSSLFLSPDGGMERGSGNSDHCSDSGGTSTPGGFGMNVDVDVGVGVGEGGEEGML